MRAVLLLHQATQTSQLTKLLKYTDIGRRRKLNRKVSESPGKFLYTAYKLEEQVGKLFSIRQNFGKETFSASHIPEGAKMPLLTSCAAITDPSALRPR